MITKQPITKKMNVPTEKAWEAISKIGRLDVWFPIITTCKVEGDGVGAHRYKGKVGDAVCLLTNRGNIFYNFIMPRRKRKIKGTDLFFCLIVPKRHITSFRAPSFISG